VSLLLSQGPSHTSLTDAGALTELGLGHEQDARLLQTAVAAWQSEYLVGLGVSSFFLEGGAVGGPM
jgi:hypothetical protein